MGGRELEGAPFVVKTFQLVSEPSNWQVVHWSNTKDSFIVSHPVEFAAEVLPRYFKHNNFCSFIRQLNTYGFHKVESKNWEFKHDLFKEGQQHLLKEINRRKSKKRDTTPLPIKEEAEAQSSTAPPPALGEEVEVEKLKDLNTLLLKEVLRLQHQQEHTQDTVKHILNELIESRKTTEALRSKVSLLEKELHPSPSPSSSSPSPSSPSLPPTLNSPSSPYTTTAASTTTFHSTFSPEETSLGLDELAHLELTSHFEQSPEDFSGLYQVHSPPPSPFAPPSPQPYLSPPHFVHPQSPQHP